MFDLADISVLRSSMRSHGFHHKKSLGQNFLINRDSLQSILDAGELTCDDNVVEVGPGPGVLTLELAQLVSHLTSIELDGDMCSLLSSHLRKADLLDRVSLVQADIRDAALPEAPYKVIANIPYYLTDRIIRRFLEEAPLRPQVLVLLIQKEVAEKITALDDKQSIPSIAVQAYGRAEIVCQVPRDHFDPAPKVDSAVLKITTFPESRIESIAGGPKLFFRIVRAGFGMKRKKLSNCFSANLALSKEETTQLLSQAGIDGDLRAERLTFDDWISLTEAYHKMQL